MPRLPRPFLAALFAETLLIPALSRADMAKKYQVTGIVSELDADKVVLTKADGEKWELKRDTSAPHDADLKVGAKVTIMYTMTEATVEAKPTTKPTR